MTGTRPSVVVDRSTYGQIIGVSMGVFATAGGTAGLVAGAVLESGHAATGIMAGVYMLHDIAAAGSLGAVVGGAAGLLVGGVIVGAVVVSNRPDQPPVIPPSLEICAP